MIERVLEQEQAIRVVISADRKASHLLLSWQDLDVLKAINNALSPLSEFTNVMSGEKYVTISAILPVMNLLKTAVLEEKTDDNPMTNELRSSIMDDLITRNQGPDIVNLLETASFLDPRFKEKFAHNIEDVKEMIISEATAIIVDNNIEAEQSSSPSGCPPPAKKMKQSLGSLLKQNNTEYSELPANLSPRDKIKHEIDAYLKEQNLDAEGNPLEWWRSHESTYPLMARISKKYLCVPATSTSSERVFSKGGLIVTPHRASLKPETAEMLIFLSSNL